MTDVYKLKRQRKDAPKQERICNNDPKLHSIFEPGSVSHQGDLMIVAISQMPRSAKPRTNRQLAEGDTQGSRHVMSRGEVYDADRNELRAAIKNATGVDVNVEYIAPVIFVSPAEPTEHDLTHPEHGHQGFPAGSICAVVYQRNLDAEEREARVRD